MSEPNVCRVGCVDTSGARAVRIVHISDTHLKHDEHRAAIPGGDILVHSGDFAKFEFSRHWSKQADYLAEIKQINQFFDSLPHRYKIFVSGNHETNFLRETPEHTANLLTSCLYLQDSSVTIEGIKFYGTPWNGIRHNSFARGFGALYRNLPSYWKLIPDDTDVLISHNPPFNILDLGLNKHMLNVAIYCQLCSEYHKEFMHFGCPVLRDEVIQRIRPKVHLFGHVHECNGTVQHDGILFSNAAFACVPRANVVDFYVDPSKQSTTDITPKYRRRVEDDACLLM